MDQEVDINEDDYPGTENTEELICIANELLYQQKCDNKIFNVKGKSTKFKATVLSKIASQEEAEEFIHLYNINNFF